MSEELFLQIFERALILDETFPIDLHARWIKRLTHEDADLMAKSEIQSIKLTLINASAIITYKENKYFAVSGFDEPAILPPGLSAVDATPGLFSSFTLAVKLEPTATAASIRDVVEGFSSINPDYQGHDLSIISPLFPPIHFYEIDNSYVYTNSLERVLGSYLSRGYAVGALRLSPSNRANFALFFEEGPDWVPYVLPLRGLLSFSWAGLFLELYRCIEQLYAVPKIVSLTKIWSSSETIYDISKLLEDVLSWRPREEDSLTILFKELDGDICLAVQRAFKSNSIKDEIRENYARAAKRIYALRNSCVHYRPANKIDDLTDAQWNDVVLFMLEATRQLYDQFGARFHTVKN
jgi:hypothetical protein